MSFCGTFVFIQLTSLVRPHSHHVPGSVSRPSKEGGRGKSWGRARPSDLGDPNPGATFPHLPQGSRPPVLVREGSSELGEGLETVVIPTMSGVEERPFEL